MKKINVKPMLAGKADLAKLRYPVLASPKIDGVRALVVNGQVLSRKLMVFPNTAAQRFAKLEGLDGELVVGDPRDPQVRNVTSGMLNRKTDEAPALSFLVFDMWNSDRPFVERLAIAQQQVGMFGGPNAYTVPHILIDNERQLRDYEEFKLDEGYEGLILRDPNGLYKYGRSTTNEGGMLKLKRFLDAEARVLRVNEEMENTNAAEKDNLGRTKRSKAQAGLVGKGRAGELEVVGLEEPFKGVEFVVPLGGAGDEGKKWWWEVGKMLVEAGVKITVTFRYFAHGVKDKPLLPTYVGVRSDWDRS